MRANDLLVGVDPVQWRADMLLKVNQMIPEIQAMPGGRVKNTLLWCVGVICVLMEQLNKRTTVAKAKARRSKR